MIHWIWIFHYLEHRRDGIDKKLGYREESDRIFSDLQAGTQQIAGRSPFTESQLDGTTKISGTSPFRRGSSRISAGLGWSRATTENRYRRNPIGVAPWLSAPQAATDEIAPCPAVKKGVRRRTSGGRFPSCQCATEELENGTIENDRLEVAHATEKSFKLVRRLTT